MRRALWLFGTAGLCVLGVATNHDRCERAFVRQGLETHTCPVGTVRQTARLDASALRRGAKGSVTLAPIGHYATGELGAARTAPVGRIRDVALSLVDGKGKVTPLDYERSARAPWTAAVTLPDGLADGDYKLRAAYDTPLGKGTIETALPVYAPARIHVITDRPLYEPGNIVKFRAVVLRARDLAPLDGRPGHWVVTAPSGESMLEEAAPAGDWGVVAGSFPLDRDAEKGPWSVKWQSADAVDEVHFTVEPFTLPRFRVEASADKAFYGAGASPIVRGQVVYSSGAPVANAAIDIEWTASGAWPPPRAWLERELPKRATTGANGRFELALPKVPDDLLGKATLSAQISAVDPAGDRVAGGAQVLLARDAIDVAAVTELGDGLVEGFNNRLYVRVTTPDGRVVANQKIHIKRAWQANDNGVDAQLDEDGVASLQIDPGPPVNVVIPPQPWRPAARPPLVTRASIDELVAGEGASLADQVAMDRWLPALGACAKWADDAGGEAHLGLRVDAAGAIAVGGASADPLARCALAVAKQQRLPAGRDRFYAVTFAFTDPDLPKLSVSPESPFTTPTALSASLSTWVHAARDCLPETGEGRLPSMLAWTQRAGTKELEIAGWVADPQATDVRRAANDAALRCVQSRVGSRIALEAAAPTDSLGLVRFSVVPSPRTVEQRPKATTMLGYELAVSAGEASTMLRVAPGAVPPLRMRVTPVVAKPGDPIVAELIRGPGFHAKLPEKLAIDCPKTHAEAPLGADRSAHFAIDPHVEGWCRISGADQHALVYVRPAAELAVTVAPKQPRYAPGQMAELLVKTVVAGRGSKAAVGLVGVDESLGQLAPLPGADDLARVQPKVTTDDPAFGALDGQALALGRIRGPNAAAATVLRVTGVPLAPDLDAIVSTHAESGLDAEAELTDHFYAVLAEARTRVRAWEAKAPPSEQMHPATMAKLWGDALAACAARGEPVGDAYGRKLRLSLLPADLLALVDPRALIVAGTRLPEDVENWADYVEKERP